MKPEEYQDEPAGFLLQRICFRIGSLITNDREFQARFILRTLSKKGTLFRSDDTISAASAGGLCLPLVC